MTSEQAIPTSVYVDVTEVAGENISKEQLQRMMNRYDWAANLADGKDVIEVACGTGQGLGLLAQKARSVRACDISPEVLAQPMRHFKDRNITLDACSAETLPYEDDSADVMILFEALYYVKEVDQFLSEVKRILRPNGTLLLSVPNNELYDFNPSPYTYRYFSAKELQGWLEENQFNVSLYGDTPVDSVSMVQKLLRPVKKVAVKLHLIPKSMRAKEWLKRVVFGSLVEMPAELTTDHATPIALEPITTAAPNQRHKVILSQAVLLNKA